MIIDKDQAGPLDLDPVRLASNEMSLRGKAVKAKERRERLLALLKFRYGYINDRAIGELVVLLRQFAETNKSTGVRQASLTPGILGEDEPEFGNTRPSYTDLELRRRRMP